MEESERRREQLKKDGEVLIKIGETLKTLDAEAQGRVVRAVIALLGMDTEKRS